MQTLIRATVMLGSLAIVVWAAHEFGLENTIQPIARRAITMVDDLLSVQGISSEPPAAEAYLPHRNAPPLPLIADPTGSAMQPVTLSSTSGSHDAEIDAVKAPSLLARSDLQKDINTHLADNSSSDETSETTLLRLNHLGANQITLGEWGNNGALYRCSCEMPLPNTPLVASQFNAIAETANEAAQEVLAQVESWQSQHEAAARY